MNPRAPIHSLRSNDRTKCPGKLAGRLVPASNFGVALAEKTSMQVLLRARETESDDDDQPVGRAGSVVDYKPAPTALFRLRCFACAGSGNLWVTDAICPGGRPARCVACHGTGRVEVKVGTDP